jgi:hypothetical protein
MGNPRHVLAATGAARAQIMKSEAAYRAAVSNRLLKRVTPRRMISDAPLFQGTCVAVDNRLPLPPCMPVGRNWDGVFGVALRAFVPGAFIGHVPWAVRHQPRAPRSFPPEAVRQFGFRFSELLGMLLSDIGAHGGPGDAADRMEDAGHHLMAMGEMPDRDFLSYARSRYLHRMDPYLASLDAVLAGYGEEPEFWAEDVRAHRENVISYSTSEECCVPVDLREGRTAGEALRDAQELLGGFGEMCAWWSEMREAASEVRPERFFAGV